MGANNWLHFAFSWEHCLKITRLKWKYIDIKDDDKTKRQTNLDQTTFNL